MYLYLSSEGHLYCFYLLAFVNSAAMNICVQVSSRFSLSSLAYIYLEVELLICRILFKFFGTSSILCSRVGCLILPPEVHRVSLYPKYPLQPLLFSSFDSSHLRDMRQWDTLFRGYYQVCVSRRGLNLISRMHLNLSHLPSFLWVFCQIDWSPFKHFDKAIWFECKLFSLTYMFHTYIYRLI